MTDKFLYEDGVELSLSKAYTFIQNIANNRIRNFTRMITQSAGFLDDSFEVVALEKDLSQSSTYYLKLKVGGVVFPNGEVFKGNEFVCRVALNKSSSTQYLKVKSVSLRRTEQKQAFGAEGYAETLDGAKLDISGNPEPADDGSELLIAAIDYLPDMDVPDVSDRRDPWIFFWSSSTIINPLEILDFDVINIMSSKSTWHSTSGAILDSPDMNSETSTILYFSQFTDANRHAWDLLVESVPSGTDRSFQRVEPYSMATEESTITMRLPQGLEAKINLRKQDAYRAGVNTEWAEIDDNVYVSYLDSVFESRETPITAICEYIVHYEQPYLGVKIYTDADLGTSCFVKIWLAEEDNIDKTKPPGYIIGLPSSVVGAGDELTYILLPYDKSAGTLYLEYEVISPAHNILFSNSKTISVEPPNYGEEETICIYFGSDRLTDDPNGATGSIIANPTSAMDEDGSRLYYTQDAVSFYIPQTQDWPLDEYGQISGFSKRYLAGLEFINYANYVQWVQTGVSFQYYVATDDVYITVTYRPPVYEGDTLVVSGSSDATALANGNYTIQSISFDGTDWIILVNNPAAIVGADTPGTCDVNDLESATPPLASVEIIRGGRGDTVIYSGTLKFGQDRDIHFPDTFYHNVDTDIIKEDNEFWEANTYIVRVTRDSGSVGYEDHMNVKGVLKLKFVKKVV